MNGLHTIKPGPAQEEVIAAWCIYSILVSRDNREDEIRRGILRYKFRSTSHNVIEFRRSDTMIDEWSRELVNYWVNRAMRENYATPPAGFREAAFRE